MVRKYESFVIRIDEISGEKYPITAEYTLGGEESGSIPADLPLINEKLVQQALIRMERGFINQETDKNLGKDLFKTLFPEPIEKWFRDCINDSQNRLRIVLKFPLPASLAHLPWELIYDEEGDEFLARSYTTPFTRRIELGKIFNVPTPVNQTVHQIIRVLEQYSK